MKGIGVYSDGVEAAFAGADTNHVFNRDNEDLPVTDAAGMGRLLDRFDRTFDQ